MNRPQAGDFFLVPIPGYVGNLIRVGQWLNGDGFGAFEHAGIYLGDGLTVEAMPGGAIQGRIANYDPDHITWSSGHRFWRHSDSPSARLKGEAVKRMLTPAEREQIITVAKGMIGVPYSVLDYVSLAMVRFRVRPPFLKRYIESNKHMICSQLVDRVYEIADIQLFADGRIPGDVTPGDLYRVLNA